MLQVVKARKPKILYKKICQRSSNIFIELSSFVARERGYKGNTPELIDDGAVSMWEKQVQILDVEWKILVFNQVEQEAAPGSSTCLPHPFTTQLLK